uniref:ELM2 domain-containing protein n=1 Tax=Gongylonema pulchrum TaxID=637853 RepID=A0A183CZ95_9BILA
LNEDYVGSPKWIHSGDSVDCTEAEVEQSMLKGSQRHCHNPASAAYSRKDIQDRQQQKPFLATGLNQKSIRA